MEFEKIYSTPKSVVIPEHPACAGCFEAITMTTVASILDEVGIPPEEVTAVWPAGCSGMGASSSLKGFGPGRTRMNWNHISGPHGRGHAVATGLKRARPEKTILVFQGDGDLAGIGLAETIHAANRGEHFTVFFVNNQVYATTGGQMAPTTLVGQQTTTTPFGRDPKTAGYPLHMCEIISSLAAPVYVARATFTDPQNIMFARKCIKKALECQRDDRGYAFVELLVNCPSNWHMSPEKSVEYIKEVTSKEFPIGEFKTFE